MTSDDTGRSHSDRGLSVTITGARSTQHLPTADLAGMFDAYLRPFVKPDAHIFIGGAGGIDTMALNWILELASAPVTVVVPCTVAAQPTEAAESITHWKHHGLLAEVVELRAPKLGTAAYHARNRWMVDRSDLVIGFPHGDNPNSGTWYTIGYATSQRKPRLVVPI